MSGEPSPRGRPRQQALRTHAPKPIAASRFDAPHSSHPAVSSDDAGMPETRAYRFAITFEAEPGHPAFDDPEWAADAAWEALANEYDLRAVYTDIEEVQLDQPL
jgi:hypothetical protein